MKRTFVSLFFCLTLLGASAAAVKAESIPAKNAAMQVSLPTITLQETATARCTQGSMLKTSSGIMSAEPQMCLPVEEEAVVVHYSYTDSHKPFTPVACSAEAAAPSPEYKLSGNEIFFSFNSPNEKGCINGLAKNEETADEFGSLDSMPDVPIVVNRNVESFINYFQTSGRKYFEKWWNRSRNYMTMLRSILRENGVPEDISYIAFIESGLNPTAKSHANAVGMWQFIKGTATRYGLRVDWWVDERMDPEKATYAAAKYFKNLYGQFGSWYLAAAGYNAGEGRVVKAIKKHGTEDFWELASQKKPFRKETKDYVPKYLAALMIAKDPTTYGFDQIEHYNGTSYEKVRVAQATDLRVIADAAGTSVEEIRRLNPELLRRFTPPNYPNYEIKIPVGTKAQFVENIDRIPAAKKVTFISHKVRRGETIAKIAKKYNTSVNPIMYLNNISKPKVKPGTIIMVPIRADGVASKNKNKTVALMHWDMRS